MQVIIIPMPHNSFSLSSPLRHLLMYFSILTTLFPYFLIVSVSRFLFPFKLTLKIPNLNFLWLLIKYDIWLFLLQKLKIFFLFNVTGMIWVILILLEGSFIPDSRNLVSHVDIFYWLNLFIAKRSLLQYILLWLFHFLFSGALIFIEDEVKYVGDVNILTLFL